MILSEESRTKARAMVHLLRLVPDGEFVMLSDFGITFSAATQEEARKYRTLFLGVLWEKSYTEFTGWKYSAKIDGVDVAIYCGEKPPMCKRIETKRIVTKKVPIGFEEKEVEETVITYDCGGSETGHDADNAS